MSYEFQRADFATEDRVNPRAVKAVLAGLGIGMVFWSVLFFIVAG